MIRLVNIVIEPHALYTCSLNLLRDSRRLADKYGVPIATHYLETKSEKRKTHSKVRKISNILPKRYRLSF